MYECVGGGRGGAHVERGKGSISKHFFGSFLEGGFQLGDSSVLEHLHLIYMQGRGDPRVVFTSTKHCFTLILTSVNLSLSFSEISLAPYTSLPISFMCVLLRKGGINVK